MSQQDCLTWLHGGAGFPDGHSAMLSRLDRKPQRLTKECIQAAQSEIREYAAKLTNSGRYTLPHGADAYDIGVHRWFLTTRDVAEHHASNWTGNNSDPLDTQMGMYVFDQSRFDLAMQSWHTNVYMEKGSDIIRAPDATFDKSVVGYLTYIVDSQESEGDDCNTWRTKLEAERVERERKGRTLQDEIDEFNQGSTSTTLTVMRGTYEPPPRPQPSIVVEFIGDHAIRISRKAKSCKDGWAAMFAPAESF